MNRLSEPAPFCERAMNIPKGGLSSHCGCETYKLDFGAHLHGEPEGAAGGGPCVHNWLRPNYAVAPV